MATDSLLQTYDTSELKDYFLASVTVFILHFHSAGHSLITPKSQRQQHRPGSEDDFGIAKCIVAAAATSQLSHQQSAAPESIPELPATVPDSQFAPHVESQLEFLPSVPSINKETAFKQKMTSQGSDATQELSQSHYDEILSRSRSELQLQERRQEQEQIWGQNSDHDNDDDDETGITRHEGDGGFIDLVSSFEAQEEVAPNHQRQPAEEPEDSAPIEVDFTLTQSQQPLSQFPESQRFKTPATAGKKRRYNGDVIDSPELPRNPIPLLRGGDTNASLMGLSQAFAATQANTSPFIENLNKDLQSDRPSPDIGLQPRPMTAISSSPMRPISTVKRATTEPADQYVSSAQSQVRREEARRREFEKNYLEDRDSDGDDDFGISQDSWIKKDRKERERNRKIRELLSSPTKKSGRNLAESKSSPLRKPAAPSPQQSRPIEQDASVSQDPQSQVTESEEETEQEDNGHVAVARSSQMMIPIDEENKENCSDRGSQIPETTARLHRVINEVPSQVQESPLLRHGQILDDKDVLAAFTSSQPFAVADSQPDQFTRQPAPVPQIPPPFAANEDPDFVPQSPESSPQPTALICRDGISASTPLSSTPEVTNEQTSPDQDPVPNPLTSALDFRSDQALNSTIPETSSNEAQPHSDKVSDQKSQSGDGESRGAFETAQSHLPTSTSAPPSPEIELSSPPILTTPPNKRRKRMAEIAADPSPLKSQVSFNASEALHVDVNFLLPANGTPTLQRVGAVASEVNSPRTDILDAQKPDYTHVPEHEEASTSHNYPGLFKSHPEVQLPDKDFHPPERDAPTRSRRSNLASTKVSRAKITEPKTPASISRVSQYDLPESPPRKAVFTSTTATRLKRKAIDITDVVSDEPPRNDNKRIKFATTVVRPKSPEPEAVTQPEGSPDPAAPEESGEFVAPPVSHPRPIVAELDIEPVIAPNMVFAMFNGKSRTYYPAHCLGPSATKPSRYTIQWEGYSPDEVDEYGVRSLDLQIGDLVKIDKKGFPRVSHVIRGLKNKINFQDDGKNDTITDIRGYQTLVVAPKQRKSLPTDLSTDAVKEIPISAIYLDSVMWGQMRERTYEYKPVFTSGNSTPLDRSFTPSTPPSRNRQRSAAVVPSISFAAIGLAEGIFKGMTFAISYKDDSRRTELVNLIRRNGGLILKDSFLDLFEQDSVQLRPECAELVFTALLTERHSRKPKYLQALALGFPCLSGKWIEACIRAGQVIEWASHLLAAGESKELEGGVKSRILPLPSNVATSKVSDMVAASSKVFANSRVIVIMGKRQSKKADSRRQFLSLIRTLGPQHIDLETDLDGALAIIQSTPSDEKSVDYVFVDNEDVNSAKKRFSPINPPVEQKVQQTRRKGGQTKRRDSIQSQSVMEPESTNTILKPNVKVMCNDDIVESLILGRIWIGS